MGWAAPNPFVPRQERGAAMSLRGLADLSPRMTTRSIQRATSAVDIAYERRQMFIGIMLVLAIALVIWAM